MDAIVQLVEEASGREAEHVAYNWVPIEHPGFNFRGRFVPDNEYSPDIFDKAVAQVKNLTFESWLRQITTLVIDTEVNVQLGEFTIKKHVIRPLEKEMTDFDDFETVFGNKHLGDVVQCAEVKHTSNRKWVRLVGLGFDLQLWKEDPRPPAHNCIVPYGTISVPWVKAILNPWLPMILPNVDLFVAARDVAKLDLVVLFGIKRTTIPAKEEGKEDIVVETLKEVVVYRYNRVFQIFDVLEHGRRWFRSLRFSSDPSFALHDLKLECISIKSRYFQCCGDPSSQYRPEKSLVIIRDIEAEDARRGSSNRQTFIPHRFLLGLMPSTLMMQYEFWQNEDESLTGYMPIENAKNITRSVLSVSIVNKGYTDNTGFCNSYADAKICRILLVDDVETNSVAAAFETNIDSSKPKLFLINLLSVMNTYGEKFPPAEASTAVLEIQRTQILDFNGEEATLHALVRMMLRLDSMANILAWSKTDPSSGKVSIDIVELPRLRLTFEKTQIADGSARYFCLEQTGLFITGYREHLNFGELLEGLPHAVLLSNVEEEYFVLLPAIAKPSVLAAQVEQFDTHLMLSRTDSNWIGNTGESAYFVYPVHISGCFMSSRSVGSTLYLLLFRFIMCKYVDAFKLIECSVCDRALTNQEKQFYDILSEVTGGNHPDAHACRLKLYFVTYGCIDIMPYPFNIERELMCYIAKFKLVSAQCRLTYEEEAFIMGRVPQSSNTRKSALFINRDRLIKAAFDLTFERFAPKLPSKGFAPTYPSFPEQKDYIYESPANLDMLDPSKQTFKSAISKVAGHVYTRPEGNCSGAVAIQYILSILEGGKFPGYVFIFELLNQALPITILSGDEPHSVGCALLRFLPKESYSGLEGVMLRVMAHHPELAVQMPKFEDKRKLRLPTLSGLDIYQQHMKSCATIITNNAAQLDAPTLTCKFSAFYKPPVIVQVAVAPDDGRVPVGFQRLWIAPKISDFDCPKRIISLRPVPQPLQPILNYFNQADLAAFMTTPMSVIGVDRFMEHQNLARRGEIPVQAESPPM